MSGVERLRARAENALRELDARRLRRDERVRASAALDFCSNDYLGLAEDPDVVAEVRAKIGAIGAGASRLVSGTRPEHVALEAELASWFGADSARLFSTGYQANLATLGAILHPGDRVISDALNHASLIDAMRLTRAERVVVPHGDVAAVRDALRSYTGSGMCVVVTESIFSMDGDLAPLADLAMVCDAAGAALVVDEAHAIGVLGPQGAGACAALGVEREVALRLGTGGKALGAHGAFAVGPEAVMDLIQSRGRAYIYTTALSPMVTVALQTTLPRVRTATRRVRLCERRAALAEALRARDWWRGPDPPGAIFPLVVGDAERALAVSSSLENAGFFARAIRPPTVPAGTSRIRVTVSARHSAEDVAAFAAALPERSALGLPNAAAELEGA